MLEDVVLHGVEPVPAADLPRVRCGTARPGQRSGRAGPRRAPRRRGPHASGRTGAGPRCCRPARGGPSGDAPCRRDRCARAGAGGRVAHLARSVRAGPRRRKTEVLHEAWSGPAARRLGSHPGRRRARGPARGAARPPAVAHHPAAPPGASPRAPAAGDAAIRPTSTWPLPCVSSGSGRRRTPFVPRTTRWCCRPCCSSRTTITTAPWTPCAPAWSSPPRDAPRADELASLRALAPLRDHEDWDEEIERTRNGPR